MLESKSPISVKLLLNKPSTTFPDLPYFAGRKCKGAESENLKEIPYQKKIAFLLDRMDEGHLSLFEHVLLTWEIDGVSRACVDQLNRYRIASMCVDSARYIDAADRKFIVPTTIANTDGARQLVEEHVKKTTELYIKLQKDFDIPRQDARCIIELGRESREIFSCNLREFFTIRKQRLCKSAQEEIRELVRIMSEIVLADCPDLFKFFMKAIPECSDCPNHAKCGSIKRNDLQ